jgi:hypothetical protein
MKTAVVMAFERLPLCLLGCYGRNPSPTPHIDRFADESVVFDWHFAENVDSTDAATHAWWTGRFQFPISDTNQRRQGILFEVLSAAHVEIAGVCEPVSKSISFPRTRTVTVTDVRRSAGSQELFREASTRLAHRRTGTGRDRLLWILSSEIAVPNDGRVGNAMQLRAVDESFGRFFEIVRNHSRETGQQLLVIVTAAAGMPDDNPEADRTANRLPPELRGIAESNVHTPMIVHCAGSYGGLRQSSLVQNVDLAPTLLDWFGVDFENCPLEGESLLPMLRHETVTAGRDFVCFGDGPRSCGIRTREFCLLVPSSELERTVPVAADSDPTVIPPNVRLFVKPDDAWEVHNIAGQEPETVANLLDRLREFVSQRGSG